jgi:predicted O-methyltransferase YrrM
MKISTVLLNWNRSALLSETLRSYAATVTGQHEIIVVGNGSTDSSREVIADAINYLPELRYLFFAENFGGEAINLGVQKVIREAAPDDLLQIAENDQIFLPGWSEHVRQIFAIFHELGQLSLHGVMQSDNEIGNPLPGGLRFERGHFLYQTNGNVGTASIIPARVFRQYGLKVQNIQNGDSRFKFPDDGRLSSDIQKLGLFCAWSHKSFTHSLGHDPSAMSNEPEYFADYCAAKPALGAHGYQRLVAEALSRPKVKRRSIVFSPDEIQPERTAQSVGDKPSRLWSMFDGWTAEVETLDLLYSLVRLLKPRNAVETGTWLGRSAVSIGSALRDNGFGVLTSIEINQEAARVASARLTEFQLEAFVSISVGPSLEFDPQGPYDFALFDSDIPIRADEFRRFYDAIAPDTIIVFHDTAAHHPGSADNIHDLMTMGLLEGLFFATPRGLFVGKIVKPPHPTQGVLRQLPRGFDAAAYYQANPDVRAANADAAEHYRAHGWREGRRLAL